MYIDILPIDDNLNGYRGLDRMLQSEYLYIKKGLDQQIEMYLDYVSYLTELDDSKEIFYKILPFYFSMIEGGAKCEIIISDKKPIMDFCDKEISFLGIDIVNRFHESALLGLHHDTLNGNGLCENIHDAKKLMEELGEAVLAQFQEEMVPNFVYKVLC